jgi:amino acid transporter
MSQTPASPPTLLRALGPLTAVAVVVGSVIGSGVFKKPSAVAANIPYFEWAALAWVLGGVLALLGALALAELGAMLPRAGGNYVILKEGYSPLWGFLWGWIEFWILRTGSIAALATVFSESFAQIIKHQHHMSDWEIKGMTAAVIAVLAAVNVVGVRWGGLVQDLTTWLKVGSLLAIAVLPFAMGAGGVETLTEHGKTPDKSFVVGFGAAVLAVLWAYHGWMNLSPLGEEVRDPQRNVPRALLFGVGIIIVVYLGANLAYALVLPQEEMKGADVVAASFAERVFLPWGSDAGNVARQAISAAIMLSVFGALNANILIGPRTYFAMGRDGLYPKALGRVHPTFRTPVNAIVTQAGWAIGLVFVSAFIRESEDEKLFDTLTDFVMFGAIIFETMVIAAIFRFRKIWPDVERPYRCWGYPWVPAVYVVIMAGVLAVTVIDKPMKTAAGFAFIATGALVYFAVYRGKGQGAAEA